MSMRPGKKSTYHGYRNKEIIETEFLHQTSTSEESTNHQLQTQSMEYTAYRNATTNTAIAYCARLTRFNIGP